jgi:integrase
MGTRKSTFKFTKRAVDALVAPTPSGKQTLYWDSELKGFGVLVSGATNSKTYIVNRRVGATGTNRRLTVGATNEKTLDEARDKAAHQLNELREGRDPKALRKAHNKITVQTALDDYLAARVTLRERSRDSYKRAIEGLAEEWLGKPILSITSEMVIEKHRKVQKEIAAREAKRNAKNDEARRIPVTGHASADSLMRAFRAVWNLAYERARRADPNMPTLPSPVGALRQERAWFTSPRRDTFVRADQLPDFYKAVCGLENRTGSDYVKLLLFTGLRRTEAAELHWDDVDFAARIIRLPAARTKSGVKLDLPMTDFVRDLIVARRTLGKDGDFVFSGNGRSKHLEEPKSFFTGIEKSCGVRVGAHDMRRTFITHATDVAISSLALKALVNHALGGDVTEGYARITTEQLRKPAQMICDRLKELCGIEAMEAPNVASMR